MDNPNTPSFETSSKSQEVSDFKEQFRSIFDRLDALEQRRISQSSIPPQTVKSRHLESNILLNNPFVNEEVSLVSTSTELNLLNGITVLSGSNTGDQDTSILAKLVNRQDNTTNSVVSNQLVQVGWGFVLGDGANRYGTKTVTFPIAYDSVPIVLISGPGFKASSDPSGINEFTQTTGAQNITSTKDITVNNFVAIISRSSIDGNDPGVLSNTTRYGFAWMAIGTKAR